MGDSGMSDETFLQAITLFNDGRLEEAAGKCKEIILHHFQHPGALRMLGMIAFRNNELDDVVQYMGAALEFSDPDPDTEYNLGIACRKLKRHSEAAEWFNRTISHKPDYTQAYRMLAETLELQNRIEEALQTAHAGLLLEPNDPHLNLVVSQCEHQGGNAAAALDRLDRITLPAGDSDTNQRILSERGYLLDSLHHPDEAFKAFSAANDMAERIWHGISPGPNLVLGYVRHQRETIDQSWGDRWQPSVLSPDEPDPVFLLGFPRSGTTLLNKILDMHPCIKVITEEEVINRIYEKLVREGYKIPEDLPTLDDEVQRNIRNNYRKTMSEICKRELSRPIIVDKFPLHTIFTPLIYRMFPNAKYLFALRHPYDVCLSCFMNNFEQNTAMANFHSLEGAAKLYTATMDIWQSCTKHLPLNYHTVRYELLIDDTEAETRQICSFLGIDWHPDLIDFHLRVQREGKISPSYKQVNQPIYQVAKYRWKDYAAYIGGVRSLLDPWLEIFGYTNLQD